MRRDVLMRLRLLLALTVTIAALVPAPLGAQPSPYVEEEVTFVAPAGHRLAGTLTLPRVPGRHPAVVLVSGSGPQNRDEEIGIPGYRPFRVIADDLTRHRIAVLRYDDRGVGKSSGTYATATSADFAEDAEAAWRYLRGRLDIDGGRIGLLGHSEGGLIAAMVAARNPWVAFVISMAGSAVNGYDVLLVQNARVLTALGASAQEVAAGVAQARVILDLVRSQRWDELRSTLIDTARRQLAALPEAQRRALPDAERLVDQQMAFYQNWMRFFLDYDPGKDWAKVRVPVLALFGVLDVQVDLHQNRAALLAALDRAHNYDVSVVVFPRANHLFLTATTGGPQEYARVPPVFVPGFLDTISQWMLDRVDR